jgi:hypothetical protein
MSSKQRFYGQDPIRKNVVFGPNHLNKDDKGRNTRQNFASSKSIKTDTTDVQVAIDTSMLSELPIFHRSNNTHGLHSAQGLESSVEMAETNPIYRENPIKSSYQSFAGI